ncbi:MAG: S8 family peptidase [Vicinamibacterales bacterium]
MVDSALLRRWTFPVLTLCVLAAACLMPATADAGDGKLDPLLRARARALLGRSRVIVEFEPGAEGTLRSPGAIAGRQLPSSLSQVVDVDNQSLESLASDPRVRRIVPDRPAFATLERTGAATGATLVHEQLGLTGAGVGIVVIDSGVTPWHDDLNVRGRQGRGTVVHFKDFTRDIHPRVWVPDTPSDEYGHGTHVAGIIAGSGYDSDGRRAGIAPDAHLVVLKVLDAQGHGHISDVIAAIDYAIAVKDRYNVRIINLSVASGVFESYRTDPLAQAAHRAVAAGLIVVASAGNLGQNDAGESQNGGITSPGNAPWVLTVGAASHHGTASRSDDRVADFSSQGPTWIDFAAKPDILAYGVGIESLAAPSSTLASTYSAYLLDGTRRTGAKPYLSLSGTSMAAPVVTGTIALMLEANPRLTPNGVKAVLEFTAEANRASPLTEGAGLLNARGAVRLARNYANPRRDLGAPGDMIAGEWVPWSQHVLWGNYMLDGVLPPSNSHAWSTSVDWGALKTSAGTPVWGSYADDNIVWSTTARNGRNVVWGTYFDDNIVWSTARDDDNIVWSTYFDDNIVWSTAADRDDNIVWSTARDDDNIVWSTSTVANVVWGTDCGSRNCRRVLWGDDATDGSTWGTARDDDNIVWSTYFDDNIVWSTAADRDDNIVWSTAALEPVLWAPPPAIVQRRRTISPSR